MKEVTRILSGIEAGDPQAAQQLLPLVYDELHKHAAQKLAQETPGQTLQATALVHEAFLRLVGDNAEQGWDNRRHFFAAAAEAMRHILIDNARRKQTRKHGGDRPRQELDADTLQAPEPNLVTAASSTWITACGTASAKTSTCFQDHWRYATLVQ